MEWKRTKDQSRLSRIVKVGSLDLEMIKSWIFTSRLSVRPIPGAACVVQCHPQFNISTNALQWFKEKLTPSIVVGIIVTIIIMIVIIIVVLVMRIKMNLLSSGKACNEERWAAEALEDKGETHREQAENCYDNCYFHYWHPSQSHTSLIIAAPRCYIRLDVLLPCSTRTGTTQFFDGLVHLGCRIWSR